MTQINLKQGDATTLTEVISGLSSLSGYTAKLYIYTKAGVEVAVITGTASGLSVTYEIVNENSKVYPAGLHDFETKLFDASDHVYTPCCGTVNIEKALKSDPS
jgi:hypothetical protein